MNIFNKKIVWKKETESDKKNGQKTLFFFVKSDFLCYICCRKHI